MMSYSTKPLLLHSGPLIIQLLNLVSFSNSKSNWERIFNYFFRNTFFSIFEISTKWNQLKGRIFNLGYHLQNVRKLAEVFETRPSLFLSGYRKVERLRKIASISNCLQNLFLTSRDSEQTSSWEEERMHLLPCYVGRTGWEKKKR